LIDSSTLGSRIFFIIDRPFQLRDPGPHSYSSSHIVLSSRHQDGNPIRYVFVSRLHDLLFVHPEVEHHPDSPPFVRIPNELKLMFADCLDLDDINTLVRITRALNWLLTPYMYRYAKDLVSRCGRPYFLRAVKAGNLTAVRHFIEVGTSVNMSDPTDDFLPTALHRCVWEGYIEMAQLLIQHGVNMSPVNHFGHTSLHEAIGGKYFGHTPMYGAIGRKSEETWAKLLV
jgi:hypothetical protein